jgi:RecA/RadA recombinase
MMVDEINEEVVESLNDEEGDLVISEEDNIAPAVISKDELKEIEESIKIDDTDKKESKEEQTKQKKKGKDVVTSNDLYEEFGEFLKNKADIVADSGLKATIPTGIDILDAILGGGFVVGGMNIIVGQPGSGKSMLAIQAMGNGQRFYNGEILTSYLDSEEATTTLRLSNLGVRNPKIKPYTDVTVEKVFKFLEGLCLFKEKRGIIDKPSVVIWDSIANTLSQKEREVDDINSVIGYKARMLSILIPKYVAKCAKYNISFIAVNQLRDVMNLGMFTAPKELKFMTTGKDMPGGTTLRFNAFQLIELKIREALTGEKGYGFDGFVAAAKTVKNKLFSPNVSVDLVGNFVTGFSNFWTNYRFLSTTGKLTTGAWNYLISLPDKKFRTKDAKILYNEDKSFKEHYDMAVKESIDQEIINKYTFIAED